MSAYHVFSPAKINLFLEVTGKRADGYHELLTLFAKLNFGDTLSVEVEDARQTLIDLNAKGPLASLLPPKEKNLVYRAAEKFFETFAIRANCNITLEKQIPMGAGLGGGSSNAGSVLKTLARHYNKDIKDIIPFAAKLGADIPLFLYDDTFLLGEGIGEMLTAVPYKEPLPYIVCAYPNVHISTKDVFNRLVLPDSKVLLTNKAKISRILGDLASGAPLDKWGGLLYNRLESAVLEFSPEVKGLKERFRKTGCNYIMMSGSGSSVFGLFENELSSVAAAGELKEEGYFVFQSQFGAGKY